MRLFNFLLTFLFTIQVIAQTAPLKGKGQAQSTFQTIERLESKNSGVTVTGDKSVLLEGDPDNLLVNPGFEHQTFGTGWTVNAGTATVDTANFFDGKKSMSIALSAVTGDIVTQCVTPTQQMTGVNLMSSLRVKTTLTNLQVCSMQGSTEIQCNNVSASDTWADVFGTMVGSAASQCVKLKSTSSATGTVKVDAGYVGVNRSPMIATNTVRPIFTLIWTGTASMSHDTDNPLAYTSFGGSTSIIDQSCGTYSNGVFTMTCRGKIAVNLQVRQVNVVDAILARQGFPKLYRNGSMIRRGGSWPGVAGNNVNSGGSGGAMIDFLMQTDFFDTVEGQSFQGYFYQANGGGNARDISQVIMQIMFIPEESLVTTAGKAIDQVGSVLAYARTCPDGTLEANGAAVSRTTYSKLFSAIGTAHGTGDGSTTFNLPDYRGRFLRGQANGSTLDPDRAARTAMATGGATGDNVGSVQADQYLSHVHTQDANFLNPSLTQTNLGLVNGSGTTQYTQMTLNGKNTGSAGGNETRPVNAYVKYCVVQDGTTFAQIVTGAVLAPDYSGTTYINTVNAGQVANYTLTARDETVFMNGNLTYTLPSATTMPGKKFTIIQSGSSGNGILQTAAGTVCGNSSIRLIGDRDQVTVQAVGNNWEGLYDSCRRRHEFSFASNCGVTQFRNVVASSSKPGTGQCQGNWGTGAFSGSIICTCTPTVSSSATEITGLTTSAINTLTVLPNSANRDELHYCTCAGNR